MRTTPADHRLLQGVNQRSIARVEEALCAGGNPNRRVIAQEQGHSPTMGPRARTTQTLPAMPAAEHPEDLPLLTWAIRKATPLIVQRLIQAGADVELPGGLVGRRPVHEAALTGKVLALKALIAAGANVHVRDDNGASVFDWQHPKVRTVLHASGFSLETPGVDGWRPLHHAAGRRDPQPVRWCLQRGAKVNAVNAQGATPLHVASGVGHNLAVIHLLLSAGADLTMKDHAGRCPYEVALALGPGQTRAFDEAMARHEAVVLKNVCVQAVEQPIEPRTRRRL